MNTTFDMVAKTFQGLEEVLAEELRGIGAAEVQPGKRMVSFKGDLSTMYRANFCCRTALRILKPFYTFDASDADSLYAGAKQFDWSSIMSVSSTFALDTVVYSDEFRNSQYVTYRIKDAIVDWFRDHSDDESRPSVRLDGADVMINVHIAGRRVTLSLDSSGESLHKRGWRAAQTDAPISEVLAAGIILMSGWKGDKPFIDPMCGSGTFAIEAAMIAAGIYPGVYRKHFAFENWADFDAELFESIYNDDSNEREVTVPITAADIDKRALGIARTNAKNAGVERYITFEQRSMIIAEDGEQTVDCWHAPQTPAGVIVTNPPYGKRITVDDMNALYHSIGTTLKRVFVGWDAWIIGYTDEYFNEVGLAPSTKVALYNGGLECQLREYKIFEGKKSEFRRGGGRIKEEKRPAAKDNKTNRANKTNKTYKTNKPYKPNKPYESDKPETAPRRRLTVGRQPSISADKEIVVNRPMWRQRKNNKSENDKSE